MLNAWLKDYGVKQVSSTGVGPGAPLGEVRERTGEPRLGG